MEWGVRSAVPSLAQVTKLDGAYAYGSRVVVATGKGYAVADRTVLHRPATHVADASDLTRSRANVPFGTQHFLPHVKKKSRRCIILRADAQICSVKVS